MTPRTEFRNYDILGRREWLEWNANRLDLSYSTKEYSASGVALTASVYRSAKGRIIQPNLTPYLAMSITAGGHDGNLGHTKVANDQWHEIASALAEDLLAGNPSGYVPLPPSIKDVRPFQWAGFIAEPRYTYTVDIPYDPSESGKSLRKQIRRAANRGYAVTTDVSADDVFECLSGTSTRKQFRNRLSAADIRSLVWAVGPERARLLGVKSPSGEIVSAGIRLVEPGSIGLGWVQGTHPAHLSSGVAQLVQSAVLDDLAGAKATSYDYMGANIASVAKAKSAWNMRLTTYFALRLPSSLAKVKKKATGAAIKALSQLENRSLGVREV